MLGLLISLKAFLLHVIVNTYLITFTKALMYPNNCMWISYKAKPVRKSAQELILQIYIYSEAN